VGTFQRSITDHTQGASIEDTVHDNTQYLKTVLKSAPWTVTLFILFDGVVGMLLATGIEQWEVTSWFDSGITFERLVSIVALVISALMNPERGLVLTIPMLLSSLLLAPFFGACLAIAKQRLSVWRYYLTGSLGGVGFGFAACPMTGFFFGIVAGFQGESSILSKLVLVYSSAFISAFVGILSVFHYFFQIIVVGGCFGALNAFVASAIVRRLSHRLQE
jgi:hypothetical protein